MRHARREPNGNQRGRNGTNAGGRRGINAAPHAPYLGPLQRGHGLDGGRDPAGATHPPPPLGRKTPFPRVSPSPPPFPTVFPPFPRFYPVFSLSSPAFTPLLSRRLSPRNGDLSCSSLSIGSRRCSSLRIQVQAPHPWAPNPLGSREKGSAWEKDQTRQEPGQNPGIRAPIAHFLWKPSSFSPRESASLPPLDQRLLMAHPSIPFSWKSPEAVPRWSTRSREPIPGLWMQPRARLGIKCGMLQPQEPGKRSANGAAGMEPEHMPRDG